jgi:hypothetical protein
MADGLAPVAFTDAQLERLAGIADVVAEGEADADGDADVVLGHWGCPPLDGPALDALPRLRLLAYAAGTVREVGTP